MVSWRTRAQDVGGARSVRARCPPGESAAGPLGAEECRRPHGLQRAGRPESGRVNENGDRLIWIAGGALVVSPRSADSLRGIACCQATVQVISTASASESRIAERSRTTSAPSRSIPSLVGPSKIPRRPPSQRRCSASATSRAAMAHSLGPAAETPATIASRGWSRTSTTIGRVGSKTPASSFTWSSATRSAASSSGWRSRRSAARETERRRASCPRGRRGARVG
jgi:hypothetical protein